MKCYACNSKKIDRHGNIFHCEECNYIQKKCTNEHLIPIESNFCNVCGVESSKTIANGKFVSIFNNELTFEKLILASIEDVFIDTNTFYFRFLSYIILINPAGNYFVFNQNDNSNFQGKFIVSDEIKKIEYNNSSIFIQTGKKLIKIDWNNFLSNKNDLIEINKSTRDFLLLLPDNFLIILTSKRVINYSDKNQSFNLNSYSKIFTNGNYIFCFKQTKDSAVKLSIIDVNKNWEIKLDEVLLRGEGDERIDLENLIFASSEREIAFSFKTQTLFMANIKRLLYNGINLKREVQNNISSLLFTKDRMISESNQTLQNWNNFGKEFIIKENTLLPASITKSFNDEVICFPTAIDHNNNFIFYDENGNYKTKLLIHSKSFKYLFNSNNNIVLLDFETKQLITYIPLKKNDGD